jgi:hypothetical protein
MEFPGKPGGGKTFSPDFGLGIYLDAGVRINQTWIGSTKNALQFTTDFRKYVSLSAANPETVLAFWNWGSYLLAGDIPHLELPGTARDGSFRSGRARAHNSTIPRWNCVFPFSKTNSSAAWYSAACKAVTMNMVLPYSRCSSPAMAAASASCSIKPPAPTSPWTIAFGRFGRKGFFRNLNETF